MYSFLSKQLTAKVYFREISENSLSAKWIRLTGPAFFFILQIQKLISDSIILSNSTHLPPTLAGLVVIYFILLIFN